MAGFLAPQINDIGAARGSGVPPVDTSVGDALSGVSKIFDAAFSSVGSGAQPTQKDRESATLQPIMQQIARLEAQREELGPAQHGARVNSLFSAAVVANPTLIAELRAGVTAITGLEVGAPEVDLAQQMTDETINWLTTDPEGVALAPGLFVYDTNGEIDNDLTILNAIRARAQTNADDAELARLTTQLGIEQATSGINEVRLKGVVDEWLFKSGKEAQEHVQGVIRGALNTGATVADGATVLAQLRDQRTLLANRFEAKARAGGFANHPDWNVGIALAPYDNFIASLTAKQEDIPRIFEALRSADAIAVGELINGVTGVGGFQPDVVDYVFSNIIISGSAELTKMAEGLRASKTIVTLADQPLFTPEATPVTQENPPVEGGSTTTEAQISAAGLSTDERRTEVTTGLVNFGAYLTENAVDESYRATAVESFTLASAAMTTSPQPVAVATFDKMYDTKFFDTYTSVVGFGDETAGRLQNEVSHNLAVIFSQRETLARTRLSNAFTTLPSLNLTFSDGKVMLAFDTLGEGVTLQEKSILAKLDKFGLPRNMEGLLKLRDRDPVALSAVQLGAASGNLQDINKEVAYLNKIVSVVSRLPDLSSHLLPKIEERFETKVIMIHSREEYTALPVGTNFSYQNDDGSVGFGITVALEGK